MFRLKTSGITLRFFLVYFFFKLKTIHIKFGFFLNYYKAERIYLTVYRFKIIKFMMTDVFISMVFLVNSTIANLEVSECYCLDNEHCAKYNSRVSHHCHFML